MTALRRIGWLIGVLLLLLLLVLLWLSLTPSGLRTGLALTARLVPGELRWEEWLTALRDAPVGRSTDLLGSFAAFYLFYQRLGLDWLWMYSVCTYFITLANASWLHRFPDCVGSDG